jgi:hypothetical protein
LVVLEITDEITELVEVKVSPKELVVTILYLNPLIDAGLAESVSVGVVNVE